MTDRLFRRQRRPGFDVGYLFIEPDVYLYECRHCSLLFFHPIVIGDERFYQHLQNLPFYYLESKAEYEAAARYVGDEMSVLEIGCGTGAFAGYINTKEYIGLELNQRAVAATRERGMTVSKATIEEYSASHVERHDVVVAFQVLEHIPNTHQFIRAALTCLRRDGLLIFAVPADDSFIGSISNLALNLPPHHNTRWRDRALQAVGEVFNLTVEAILHMPLEKRHRRFWLHNKLVGLLSGSRRRRKAVDASLWCKLVTYGAYPMSHVLCRVMPMLQSTWGHTVLGVFRK